jgi:hypothetical protein
MNTRALTLTALGGLMLAGCSLPPASFPISPITVPYSTFVPNDADGIPLPGLPAFNDLPTSPNTIPVPAGANALTLNSLVLTLQSQNKGPLPLVIKLYLSSGPADPYTQPPLGGDSGAINLPANGPQTTNTYTLDPKLAQQSSLKLGFKISSPGSTQTVTFSKNDAVYVQGNITAQVKLF